MELSYFACDTANIVFVLGFAGWLPPSQYVGKLICKREKHNQSGELLQ